MDNTNFQEIFENNPPLEDLFVHPQWKEWITSEVFVYQLINKTNFTNLEDLPADILNKPAIILSALEKFYISNQQIPGQLSVDKSFFMYCCDLDYKYAKLFSAALENNEDIAKWYMTQFKGQIISAYLPHKHISNKPLAKQLLKNNIDNYQHLSPELRNDLSLYKSFNAEERRKTFPYVGSNINSNWALSLAVVLQNPYYYQFVDKELRKNPEFYLDALKKITDVRKIKILLKFADDVIKDNEHCIWQTALRDSTTICFASERLLNSVSFAEQVLGSMTAEDIQLSFDCWSLHVKNSYHIFEDLLPKLIEANSLNLLGPEAKDNSDLMLKAILIDSGQTLSCCSPSLLSDSSFIIKAYHLINEKNLHENRYDEDSEQSRVFNHITEKAANDEHFVLSLYKEFKELFVSIIYPKMKVHHTPLIQQLNILHTSELELTEALNKMVLRENLERELPTDNTPKKKLKV